MLVLTRKPGETILIDGSIRVQVVAIRGNHVKLGFAAPESVGIVREELTDPRPRPSAPPVEEPADPDLAAAR
jgi:carbon storage regulator CsrA